MPGWSAEIATVFIRRGLEHGRAFDQMQLQKLIYIAHGWSLAATGEPLTGDRPEAWDLGPIYRRLADALARSGSERVTANIRGAENTQIESESDTIEQGIIDRVLEHYGRFSSVQLSSLTRGDDAPWASVYREGEGRFREIPHRAIRDQFVRLAQEIEKRRSSDRSASIR